MKEETPRAKEVVLAMRVTRVPQGSSLHIRTLATEYRGCFVHFVKGRSLLCNGPACEVVSCEHTKRWRGYTPVLVYTPHRELWFPTVLEITEYLDLDMRPLFARGQEWEVFRADAGRGKSNPVTGKLIGDCDEELPPPFLMQPCLRQMFTANAVELVHKNPMPDRILVSYIESSPPKVMNKKTANGTEKDDRSFYDEFRKRNDQKPSPSTNGKKK